MTYLLRRLAFSVFLVFAVSSASLVLTRLAKGDFATEALGIGARPETVEQTRERLGLNRSLGAQYVDWLSRAVRLDFGQSFLYERPVSDLIPERAANTAVLAATALLVATLIGLPLGVFAGSRRGGIRAGAIRGASLVLLSMPPLLTSLLLVFVAARTGWVPIGGMRSPGAPASGVTMDLLRHLIVPALALALPLAAMFERLAAQAMAEVVGQPFVLAAFARGVPRTRVVWRDALKASLRPVAAVYGLVVGTLLGGSFAVEIITAWPGLGSLMLAALRARDVYLVVGCAGAGSIFLAFGTLLSDAALALVDPRTAESESMRALGAVVLLLAVLAALGASVLAPHASDRVLVGLLNAPPTQPHVQAGDGTWHRPFIYRWKLASQLEQRYEEDRSVRVPLAWLKGGHLVESADDATAPFLLLGADSYGRDVFSRVLFGARISLGLALVAALGAVLGGAVVGGVAGYAGGLVDDLLMRTSDILIVLPAMYVALALRSMLPDVLAPRTVFLLLSTIFAAVGAPFVARGVRAIVRSERALDYAAAASALGAGHLRLLARHLLPAARGFLAVEVTLLVPAFIVAEATLSYVGLGFPDPIASWGTMLHDASNVRAFADFPWLLAPAAAMFLVVLGLNLVLQGPSYNPLHEAGGRLRTNSDSV